MKAFEKRQDERERDLERYFSKLKDRQLIDIIRNSREPDEVEAHLDELSLRMSELRLKANYHQKEAKRWHDAWAETLDLEE
jgi:hypothetical protein